MSNVVFQVRGNRQKADKSALAEKADKSIQVTASGVLTGGGTLNGDVDIHAEVANAIQARDGLSDAVVMTPRATQDFLNARIPNDSAAAAGTDNTTVMTPLKVTGHFNARTSAYVRSILTSASQSALLLALGTASAASVAHVQTQRPGDGPEWYAATLDGGDPVNVTPLGTDNVTFADDGYVLRITEPSIVATRGLVPIEASRTYLARFAVRRRVNSVDPASDAVRLAIAWYSQSRTRLATPNDKTIVSDLTTLTTGSGRQTVHKVLARSAGSGIDIVAPAGARYWRPYVQTYGIDGPSDDIEVLGWEDITDAGAYSPDLTATNSRVTALESVDSGDRLDALEAAVSAPNLLRVSTIAAAQAYSGGIPVSVEAIETLGRAAAGDHGGGIYYEVGGDPGHAAAFVADSRWFELGGEQLRPHHCGALTAGSVCSATIQAAVEAHFALGVELYFPAGTYQLKDPVSPSTWGHVNMRLHKQAVIQATADWGNLVDSNTPLLNLIRDDTGEAWTVRIEGGKFDLHLIAGRQDGAITVSGRSWVDGDIVDVECYGAATIGATHVDSFFFIAGGAHVRVRNCRFQGCDDLAVYISGDAGNGQDSLVEGCFFRECRAGVAGKRAFQRLTVRNCEAERCLTVVATGVAAEGSPPVDVEGAKLLTVDNIRAYRCAHIVSLDEGADGSLVTNIYSVEAGYGSDGPEGSTGSIAVALTKVSNCLVSNVMVLGVNTDDDETHYGVVLNDSTSKRNTISNCKIVGNGSGADPTIAVAFQGNDATLGYNRWILNGAIDCAAYSDNIGADDVVAQLNDDGISMRQGRLTSQKSSTGPAILATISGGTIPYLARAMKVDTEGGASTDDLTDITGLTAGDTGFIRPNNSAHDIVLKHGVGRLRLKGGVDRTLATRDDVFNFRYDDEIDHIQET